MSALDTAARAHSVVAAVARRAAGAGALDDALAELPAQASARATALYAAAAGKRADQLGTATPEIEPAGPAPKGVAANRAALLGALETAIGTCYTAVQKLDDEQTLRTVGQVMAGDGQSLALLRLSMNRPPVPDAFETGKKP
jgi:hypothetical protein